MPAAQIAGMASDDVARCLEALGNPTRLEMFRLLVRAGPDGLSFGQIVAALGGAPSTLSHHVAWLARTGLLAQEKRGRETISRADYARMRAVLDYLTAECCQGVCLTPAAATLEA